MEPLRGPKRLILQAVHDIQGGSATFVEDRTVAGHVGMDLTDVRNCFMALEERGYLNVALLVNGRSALITPDGRLALRQYEASPDEEGRRADHRPEVAVRPKGLLSFDQRDADFFLQLLPGPRDKDGLPDSVLYWKSRIEERHADHTFRVGVIYGPSGCGKSSLVKAGLLPRLASHVLPVYVEATPGDTEARLIKGLHKVFPDLPGELGLGETIDALTNTPTAPGGNKALLVIDQFEQWLSASQLEEDAELVAALRRCDGVRLQAVVMVRDDFSMALFRFMKQLEVELQQSRNFSVVDTFDFRHARKVLVTFGRAFGALPTDEGEMTEAQREFVDRATLGLSQDGKVVAVRLALFAEMVRGKDWAPRLLKEVGGTQGVGAAFLEQTFSSRQANPAHRIHQRAAQAVLRALLPDTGTDIKGNMQSHGKLAEVSGYAHRPKEFEELLRILDSEVRLITPTDSAGADGEGQQAQAPAAGRYYQLTHDYLVHSLREWLTRKQRETRRGRAELRLADRAAAWNAQPENRHLPAWWEWANIRLLTRKKDWTPSQRKLMRKATGYHGLRGVALLLALLLLGWGGYEGYGWMQADKLVESIVTAETGDVPRLVEQLPPYRGWADARLLRHAQTAPDDSKEHLHASLALVPVDATQVDYLYQRLLSAEPRELPVIRDALSGHREGIVERLWGVLGDGQADEQQRFRAACALATYDSGGEDRWAAASPFVADQLLAAVQQNPGHYEPLLQALRPVWERLAVPLSSVFHCGAERPEGDRFFAASVLAEYAAARPEMLADLLLDADVKQFAVLFPRIEAVRERAKAVCIESLSMSLDRQKTDADRERLAKRQANAAVALVRLGQADLAWPLLQHSADPRARSYLIHRLSPLGAEPMVLVKRLAVEKQESALRALLLALGEFGPAQLPPSEREHLLPVVLRMYREDLDPGVHGAAEWLLRQWKQDAELNAANREWSEREWTEDRGQRNRRVQRIRQELAGGGGARPQWYVNGQGQTMVVIPEPGEFRMGSPPSEEGREGGAEGKIEAPKQVRIGYTYAIAVKEVTVAQFTRFRKDHDYNTVYFQTADSPVNNVTWYDAAAYCNWLSKSEGIQEDQWCYLPNGGAKYAAGMRLKTDYQQLEGYRLPTEAEWEFACRAGAFTSRYYGETEDLLGNYAWYARNSLALNLRPVGSLKPNDLGLFDMLGNVMEWTQDPYTPDAPGDLRGQGKGAGDEEVIEDSPQRQVPGGSFLTNAMQGRAAYRSQFRPFNRVAFLGFRPARTFR